jgi:hydroxyethylthiazole kinase-like uncharacterized protein yjeF
MKISRVEEMRELDRTAVEEFAVAEELLMENAGLAVCSAIEKELGIEGRKFVIICGTGNNGGDGLAIARVIHSMKGDAAVRILGSPDRFRGPSKMNFNIISRLPLDVKQIDAGSMKSLKIELAHCDAVVDALFGTGLSRNIEGVYLDVVRIINGSGRKVFSVDIPSGVNGETGRLMGGAVKADCTVTFGAPKIGNLLYPGYGCCGKLYLSRISFPPSHYCKETMKIEVNAPEKLPERDQNGHKGDFGDTLFISGAAGYYGAPYFCAYSFLKAGGGYSRLAAPGTIIPSVAERGSEIVFVPQDETGSGSISLKNLESLIELSGKVDMVVVGPGMSLDGDTQELVRELVKNIKKPLLIDGDGLTALSADLDIVRKRRDATILTPHLGEMSRITGIPVGDIDERKIDVLQKESAALGAVIVLKGAHSLTGLPDGRIYVNMSGNSGMASAGSGDVLTGTIAAMYGLGLPVEDAVRTGVFIHGFSGDLAARHRGEDGTTAQDLLDFLPLAVKKYRDEYEDVVKNCCGSIFPVV